MKIREEETSLTPLSTTTLSMSPRIIAFGEISTIGEKKNITHVSFEINSYFYNKNMGYKNSTLSFGYLIYYFKSGGNGRQIKKLFCGINS